MKASTLGHAILGLLAGEPLSGYDVRRWMRAPVGFFWQASHSQIYPELARLEAEGLVSHDDVPQAGKPDKKVYEITPEGLEAVREWVASPAKSGPTRDEMTLRAYLSWLVEPEEVSGLFREHARLHEEQLEQYQKTESWMLEEWGDPSAAKDPKKFASYAALRRGIGFEREYAAWCRWMVESLECEE